MPTPEQTRPTVPSEDLVSFYIEKQRRQPEFLNELTRTLWDAKSPKERYDNVLLQAVVFPNDPEGKENFIRGALLAEFFGSSAATEYMQAELSAIADLERLFELPDAPAE